MSALAEHQRPAAGEREAARLFEEHADQVFGYCRRRVGSHSDAEDATQTTFLYALRALSRGVVPECESAWLTAIAKNVCRWQLRTLNRRGSLTGDLDLDSFAGAERIDGDEEELCHDLRSALASIPETQRRALVLREWHGLTSSEIAAQLGMSRPATYALLTRARRSMAQALTTLPRQAALGLATLVYELRRTIKGILGGAGAATKTVAATTLAATVAVGGVSAARAVDGGRHIPQAPKPEVAEVDTARAHPRGVRSGLVRSSAPRTVADGRDSGESGAAGEPPTLASPATEGVVPSQPQLPDEIVGTTSPDLGPLTGLVPELPPLPGPLPELPPLAVPPLPPLPTDLVPPAPELPLAPVVPVPPSVPAVDPPATPPLPDPGLPSLP
jgi:RNA polymerase sigma factor (sigma-70 family)